MINYASTKDACRKPGQIQPVDHLAFLLSNFEVVMFESMIMLHVSSDPLQRCLNPHAAAPLPETLIAKIILVPINPSDHLLTVFLRLRSARAPLSLRRKRRAHRCHHGSFQPLYCLE